MPRHRLHNYQLLTGNMGKLYPVGLQEVLPGDTFRHSTSAMVRLSPMAAPVMHPMQIRLHHFFVPHRLVWDGFEDFITGGDDGMNADQVPFLTATTDDIPQEYTRLGSFWGVLPGDSISALPYRGHNLIYNEYYRDQDLVAELPEDNQAIQNVAWEKDYFTTCRPWEQKGADVTVPVTGTAPVRGLGYKQGDSYATGISKTNDDSAGPDGQYKAAFAHVAGAAPHVYTDLSEASAVSVNALRRAFALERFQEARAQYGSRYSEYLRYYGVTPGDARLDRPEYLGGGRVRLNVSEVLQSAPETSADPSGSEYGVGDMYGHGIGGLRTPPYRRRFPEHGYVHSYLSVRPKAIYRDLTPRHFLKKDRFDFFTKEMAHIGQQAVWKGEIGKDTDPYEVFGYQDRYSEYTEAHSQVHGEFKNLLDYWHMARTFQNPPALNKEFITCEPTKRIFNIQSHDVLWMMIQHHISANRPVQKHAKGRII